MGLDYDQLFPGRFIKAGEFGGKDVTLTIAAIETEELPQEKGGDRTRGVLSFHGTQKKWVLNRTNGECLKGMWGRDTAAWIGKRVTLYPAEVRFGKGTELGIRVKGSPDIAEEMQVEIKLPKKKAIVVRMLVTGRRPGASASGAPAASAAAASTESIPSFDELQNQGGAR